MALYFYFNETTGDLVYSDQATYSGDGYTSLGEQTEMYPGGKPNWVFDSQRSGIVTVSKDESIVGKIAGLMSMRAMFSGCGSITSFDLSGFDTSAVTDMSDMFRNCTSLTNLDLSNLDTSAVTNMTLMFGTCTNLTSLDLSGFNTSAVTNMHNMFSHCRNLTSLDLSGFNTSAAEHMDYMFNGCYDLASLDLSGFNASAVVNADNMFGSCNNLRIIDISSNMSNVLSQLPAATYYDAVTRQPYAKADIPGGSTYVRDLADLDLMATMVQTRMGINRVKHALRPSMSGIGKVLWNGRITEKATLTIPDANRYGVMAVSYVGHVPVGLAMHYITTTGKHIISGIAGSSDSNGLTLRGFQLISDDGVSWTAQDLEILSLWGTGTTVSGQWGNETDSNMLTIWGIVPSPVTQRVVQPKQ